jgi:RNA recognition motif-containing protein
MQLMRYFDPKLEKITDIKEIKNNMGASTGRYSVFFKNPVDASKFVERYDNDYFNTEEVNLPLKAYIYQLRKTGESVTEIQERYAKVEQDLGLFSQVQGYAHQKMRPQDKKGWLMLYNLPFEVQAKEVSEICKGYGKVVDMYMPSNSMNKNRGYAIVKFEKVGSANNMMNMVS